MREFIIAEIGSNFRKQDTIKYNKQCAKDQIKRAKDLGADAVKFQIYTHKELYGTNNSHDFDYWSLPRSFVPDLADTAREFNIELIISTFSIDTCNYIDPFVNYHKIAAPEATWEAFVLHVLSKDKITFCSNPKWTHRKMVKLACVSEYPANPRKYNLDKYGIKGISDHTKSFYLIEDCLKIGLNYFEVHADLSGKPWITTPDSCVSLNHNEFEEYVGRIRNPELFYKKVPDYKRSAKNNWFRGK